MSKTCSKCCIVKTIEFFDKNKQNKDGFQYYCKACRKEVAKKYYSTYKADRNKLRKEYYKNHRSQELSKQKEYSERNKDKIAKYGQQWYEDNKERVKPLRNSYVKNKRSTDPLFKLAGNMRVRLGQIFTRHTESKSKSKKTEKLIGCSFDFLKNYIENKFKIGMNWENYGEWHIDHIYPLSKASSEKELEELCHYTNLQPLWAAENIKKGNKVLQYEQSSQL